jgi:hypothetical protein
VEKELKELRRMVWEKQSEIDTLKKELKELKVVHEATLEAVRDTINDVNRTIKNRV